MKMLYNDIILHLLIFLNNYNILKVTNPISSYINDICITLALDKSSLAKLLNTQGPNPI